MAAVIPLHAVVQSVSNAARVAALPSVAIGWCRHCCWGVWRGPWWVVCRWAWSVWNGCLLLRAGYSDHYLAAGSGHHPQGRAFYVLGFYQTGLGMLAGATGPLGASVLTLISKDRDWLVVNTGVYMTINHVIRSIAYGLLGFAFAPWWQTIAAMSVAMVVGSWLGTIVRHRIPQAF